MRKETTLEDCAVDLQSTVSIEKEIVHSLNKAMFRIYDFEMLSILDFSCFQRCSRKGSYFTLSEKIGLSFL